MDTVIAIYFAVYMFVLVCSLAFFLIMTAVNDWRNSKIARLRTLCEIYNIEKENNND